MSEKMKVNPYLTSLTKINSKWVKDKHKPDAIKLLEQNIVEKLLDSSLGNDFLDVI